MNPFFIFLIILTIIAIIFWFRKASKTQGIVALKAFFIILALLIVLLIATGRLPIISTIPVILLFLFKKFALTKLAIPFIKLLAGSLNQNSKAPSAINMDNTLALKTLGLSGNPSREEIVQAHRSKMRELKGQENIHQDDINQLDQAREYLIRNKEKS